MFKVFEGHYRPCIHVMNFLEPSCHLFVICWYRTIYSDLSFLLDVFEWFSMDRLLSPSTHKGVVRTCLTPSIWIYLSGWPIALEKCRTPRRELLKRRRSGASRASEAVQNGVCLELVVVTSTEIFVSVVVLIFIFSPRSLGTWSNLTNNETSLNFLKNLNVWDDPSWLGHMFQQFRSDKSNHRSTQTSARYCQ